MTMKHPLRDKLASTRETVHARFLSGHLCTVESALWWCVLNYISVLGYTYINQPTHSHPCLLPPKSWEPFSEARRMLLVMIISKTSCSPGGKPPLLKLTLFFPGPWKHPPLTSVTACMDAPCFKRSSMTLMRFFLQAIWRGVKPFCKGTNTLTSFHRSQFRCGQQEVSKWMRCPADFQTTKVRHVVALLSWKEQRVWTGSL